MPLSSYGIFWIALAVPLVPIFLVAVICSVLKSIRQRREVKKRRIEAEAKKAQKDKSNDTENVTHKPKIQFVVDEDKRNKFRSARGSLYIPNKPKTPHKTSIDDTSVDLPGLDKNTSNIHKHNNNDVRTCVTVENDATSITIPSVSLPNGSSKDITNNSHWNYNYHSNFHGIKDSSRYIKSSNNGRRRSLGCDSLLVPGSRCNPHGHIHISDDIALDSKGAMMLSSSKSRGRVDQNHQGLKPASNGRRHSVNSTCSTLEKIPEGTMLGIDMHALKSKSEDNLVDQNTNSSSSSYLTADRHGRENKGFARSTETTIM